MSDKFKNIHVDKDTIITFESIMKFDKYDVLYQMWSFDGINAKSIIFVSSDVESLSDEELKSYVAKSEIVSNKDKITLSRKKDHTFVNFDFEVED